MDAKQPPKGVELWTIYQTQIFIKQPETLSIELCSVPILGKVDLLNRAPNQRGCHSHI